LSITDDTTGFYSEDFIRFTAPGDWATTSVNGSAQMYWVRIKKAAAGANNAYAVKPGGSIESTVNGEEAQYAFADLPASGATIEAVTIFVGYRSALAFPGNTVCVTGGSNSDNFVTLGDFYGKLMTVAPTGGAWTKALFDSMQVKLISDGSATCIQMTADVVGTGLPAPIANVGSGNADEADICGAAGFPYSQAVII